MKNVKKIVLILLIFILLPSLTYAYYMIIDNIQNNIAVVYFDHSKHLDPNPNKGLGFPCQDCHHELKTPDQKPVACSSQEICHPDKKIEGQNSALALKEAYHNMCRGCHTKNKKKYKNVPSTSDCAICHIKEIEKFINERIQKNKKKNGVNK